MIFGTASHQEAVEPEKSELEKLPVELGPRLVLPFGSQIWAAPRELWMEAKELKSGSNREVPWCSG